MPFSRNRLKGIQAGYRSGLEEDMAKYLKKLKIKFTYEKEKIKWVDLNFTKVLRVLMVIGVRNTVLNMPTKQYLKIG